MSLLFEVLPGLCQMHYTYMNLENTGKWKFMIYDAFNTTTNR